MYVWNVLYENDGTPRSAADAQRNRVNGRPVGFAKITIPDADISKCTSAAALNDAAFDDGESEILGGSARIAQASLQQTSDGRLYTLDLHIGTYSQPELAQAAADRLITPAKQAPTETEVRCKPGDEGTYCFVNPIELTVYAANVSR